MIPEVLNNTTQNDNSWQGNRGDEETTRHCWREEKLYFLKEKKEGPQVFLL